MNVFVFRIEVVKFYYPRRFFEVVVAANLEEEVRNLMSTLEFQVPNGANMMKPTLVASSTCGEPKIIFMSSLNQRG